MAVTNTTRSLRTTLSWIMILAIAGTLLYVAFQGISWPSLIDLLSSAQPWPLVAAFAVFSTTSFLRAMRWRVLLSEQRSLGRLAVFWTTMLGYLGNYLLPARAGELIRAVIIGRHGQISKSFALATTLVERLADVTVLVVVSLAIIRLQPQVPAWLARAAEAMLIVSTVAVAILIAARLYAHLPMRLLSALPIPEHHRLRIEAIVGRFLLGLNALHRRERLLAFLLITILIWPIDGVVVILIATSLGLQLDLLVALLLLAALGLSSAVPSTPGYVGVYQFVAVTILVPLGFARPEALALILAFQGVSYAAVILWGMIGLWRMQVNSRDILQLNRSATEGIEEASAVPPA